MATFDALDQRSDTRYDASGNAQYIPDAKGNAVENVYDALNRKVCTGFAPTSVAESTNGTVRSIATETVTEYEDLGRRIGRLFPGGQS